MMVVTRVLRYLKGSPGRGLFFKKTPNLGFCELIWLKSLLGELKQQTSEPMKLYYDNKAAISITHNPVYHDRTKNVGIDRHFIKEKIEEGMVCIIYVPTSSHAADVLTKSLWKPDFERLIDKLGLYNIYSQA